MTRRAQQTRQIRQGQQSRRGQLSLRRRGPGGHAGSHPAAVHGDDGQIALLVLVYVLIAATLVTVVVDTSRAFLYRRSLAAAADGAATSAASALDTPTYYSDAAATDERLPLGAVDVSQAVQAYATDARLASRFEGFAITAASTDGLSASVTLTAMAPMVFDVMRLAPDGARVEVTASAQAPYAD